MPISKDQFCQDYYNLALDIANMEIRKLNYFAYGASDTLCHDAAVHALDVCYARYDGQRASLKTYMGTIIHNKLVDLISKENRYILTDFEVRNPGEGDYDQSREEELLSFRSLSRKIPAKEKEIIIDKLLKAIKNLPDPKMTVILKLYLEDPRTYVEHSVEALGIEANYVSVLKNRAIKMLPELMDMTAEDYYDSFDIDRHLPGTISSMQAVAEQVLMNKTAMKKPSSQEKLMATMLCNIIEVIREIEKDSEV